MEEFSPKKIIALCRLAAGDSNQQSADAAGVSLSALEKWKRDPEFKKQLREASNKIFDMAIAELCSGAVESAKELRRIIADDNVSDRVKISAIQILLNTAARSRDWEQEARLERLEAALDGNPNQ